MKAGQRQEQGKGMTNEKPWDSWEKPWSKQQCLQRYLQGDISLRQMEVLSGNCRSSLEKWCKTDNWILERQNYQTRLKAEVERKVLHLISDELAESLSLASQLHFEAYFDGYWLAKEYVSAHKRKAESLEGEERAKYLHSSINLKGIDVMTSIADRGIRGMRMVAGLQYEDYGQAIAFLRRGGYEVVDPVDD